MGTGKALVDSCSTLVHDLVSNRVITACLASSAGKVAAAHVMGTLPRPSTVVIAQKLPSASRMALEIVISNDRAWSNLVIAIEDDHANGCAVSAGRELALVEHLVHSVVRSGSGALINDKRSRRLPMH